VPVSADARHGVYIGLGANLGDPRAQLEAALHAIDASAGLAVRRVSSAYRTPPWGRTDQPDFINAVAELACSLAPPEIVARLLAIERAAGRERDVGVSRWSPRVLDLDLLLDGGAVIATPACEVPHPRLTQRGFVLVPLSELAPEVEIPGHGSAAQCLARLPLDERESPRKIAALEWHAASGE
jgi:2-amino-4-hydroxy-6-hydroxymethyldihydropteridine diphosphokinase